MTGLELAYARARDIIGSKQAECLDVAEEGGASSLGSAPGTRSGRPVGRVPCLDFPRRHPNVRREARRQELRRPPSPGVPLSALPAPRRRAHGRARLGGGFDGAGEAVLKFAAISQGNCLPPSRGLPKPPFDLVI
jgi:hypothetical protein